MVSATFRFYAELNDFLAPARRGRAFACVCARAATTKHMIEALGPPHTEVALVLVNGEASGLDRILREGDRVAVYPRFARLNPGPLRAALAPMAPRTASRFVADAHLGALARMLRMAGFDTVYRNDIGDDEIAALAADGERAALTRDRDLLKRREVVAGAYVRALKPAAQFAEMVERFDLRARFAPFTLCLHCNAPLRVVAKAEVSERLPPMVRAGQHEFSHCERCGRVFWKGSHWEHMRLSLGAA
ncbi:MAG: Mut7-C RNAse domain-containing protein [Massilia sp.]